MIKHLELINFRSHQKSSFDFGNLNLIVGPNGVGKTNILEAIALISTTRSWRTASDVEVISFNQDYTRVTADDITLTIQRQPYRKEVTISGVKRQLKEIVGHLKTVLFEPEDLQLILGSPALRRHWLNVVLAQSDPTYSDSLIQYRHIILQRNRLLKRIAQGQSRQTELNFWDSELARLSANIWGKRLAFITLTRERLTEHYANVSGDKIQIDTKLETHPADTERIEEELMAVRDRELIIGQTVRGPHRDDVLMKMDGVDVKKMASRGEARSLVFALKMMELDYLSGPSQNSAKDVTLLLDDVMSELDRDRRGRLVEAAQSVQTIITTTDLDHVPEELRKEATVINLLP